MMRIRLPAAAHEARLLSDIGQMLPVAIPARCGNREDGSCRGREADDFGEWEPAIVLRSRLHGCGNSRPLTPRVRSLESEARNFLFECVLEQHPACFHPARPSSELHCACALSLRPNHPRYDLG